MSNKDFIAKVTVFF